jgi:hypothetical protein
MRKSGNPDLRSEEPGSSAARWIAAAKIWQEILGYVADRARVCRLLDQQRTKGRRGAEMLGQA